MTFASDNLTVMVVVNPQRDGSVRLDGWAAPGGRLHAELRVGDDTLTAECDDSGRFVFETVPAGPAQLVLHPTLASDPVADPAGRDAGRSSVVIASPATAVTARLVRFASDDRPRRVAPVVPPDRPTPAARIRNGDRWRNP